MGGDLHTYRKLVCKQICQEVAVLVNIAVGQGKAVLVMDPLKNENIPDSSQFIIMNRAKKVYRRLLGKKAKKYAYSPTGSLPPSPIGGNSPPVLRKESFKRSRQALNRMWRRYSVYLTLTLQFVF